MFRSHHVFWPAGVILALVVTQSTLGQSHTATSQIDETVLVKPNRSVSSPYDDFVFLTSQDVKIGLDVSRGGSIGYASAANNDINIINTHDMGREIQLSFYAGPDPYHGCQWAGQNWPWNPIGAGDCHGNHGAILELDHNDTDAHIITRPLQWACDNVPCECTFEQTFHLENTVLKVTNTLHNNRSDHTAYPPQGQELPAAYSIGTLYRLVTYNGSKPWTNDAVYEFPTTAGPPWVPGAFPVTEGWAAFINDEDFGFAIYNANVSTFLGGFAGEHNKGGATDGNTGYIAPLANIALPWNTTFTFEFALVIGNLPDIRREIYALHQSL